MSFFLLFGRVRCLYFLQEKKPPILTIFVLVGPNPNPITLCFNVLLLNAFWFAVNLHFKPVLLCFTTMVSFFCRTGLTNRFDNWLGLGYDELRVTTMTWKNWLHKNEKGTTRQNSSRCWSFWFVGGTVDRWSPTDQLRLKTLWPFT